jgi:hypothetical protein
MRSQEIQAVTLQRNTKVSPDAASETRRSNSRIYCLGLRTIHKLQLLATHHVDASRVGDIWESRIVFHHSDVFRAISIGVWEEVGC